MRQSDHRALDHARERVDLALDFPGVHVEAAGDDEIFGAADDVDVTLRVDSAEIAGDEETVGAEFGGGFFRHPPIALEHVGAFDLDHADAALGENLAALRLGDPQADAGQGKADRAGEPGAVIGVRRDHVGLGHAVAFEDRVIRPLAPGLVRLGEQRRGAADEQAHVPGRLGAQAGMFEQAGVEGRHAHQRGRARHRGHDSVGVEFRLEDHGRAGQQRDIGRHEQAMRVIDGQGVDQHVVGGEAPEADQRLRVGGKVLVRQHGALGASCRAGGVEDRRQIVGLALHAGQFLRRRRHPLQERPLAAVAEAFDGAQVQPLA